MRLNLPGGLGQLSLPEEFLLMALNGDISLLILQQPRCRGWPVSIATAATELVNAILRLNLIKTSNASSANAMPPDLGGFGGRRKPQSSGVTATSAYSSYEQRCIRWLKSSRRGRGADETFEASRFTSKLLMPWHGGLVNVLEGMSTSRTLLTSHFPLGEGNCSCQSIVGDSSHIKHEGN